MANIIPPIAPLARQVRELEFRERVDQLHTYCYIQQYIRNEIITQVASMIIGILTFTIFMIYSSILAIPCAFAASLLTVVVLNEVSFPCNVYRDVIPDLDKNHPRFTYDFARFADERGILSPETVIDAHQIFKQHRALLAQNPRAQIGVA